MKAETAATFDSDLIMAAEWLCVCVRSSDQQGAKFSFQSLWSPARPGEQRLHGNDNDNTHTHRHRHGKPKRAIRKWLNYAMGRSNYFALLKCAEIRGVLHIACLCVNAYRWERERESLEDSQSQIKQIKSWESSRMGTKCEWAMMVTHFGYQFRPNSEEQFSCYFMQILRLRKCGHHGHW